MFLEPSEASCFAFVVDFVVNPTSSFTFPDFAYETLRTRTVKMIHGGAKDSES